MNANGRLVLCGVLARRERWGLTWRGRLLAAVLLLGLGTLLLRTVHPLLAPTQRTSARLLVIEGWAPPLTMREAAAEFHSGKYDQAILIRPVLDGADHYGSGRYSGHWMARLLVAEGIPDSRLATLFPKVAYRDRTYHSALAVKQWFAEQHQEVDALNLASAGPHARRSRLLYERAFGHKVRIGIIALKSREYDPKHWWRTSEGVQDVIGEAIAYLYARFLFSPCQ